MNSVVFKGQTAFAARFALASVGCFFMLQALIALTCSFFTPIYFKPLSILLAIGAAAALSISFLAGFLWSLRSSVQFLSFSYFIAINCCVIYFYYLVPGFAWDSLDFWFMVSSRLSEQLALSGDTSGFKFPWQYNNRHGMTTLWLLSIQSTVRADFIPSLPPGWLWCANYLLMLWAASLLFMQLGSVAVTLFFWSAPLFLPLLENFGLVYGYSELLVCTSLLVGLFLWTSCCHGLYQQVYFPLVISVACVGSVIFYRNTGILYAAVFCIFCLGPRFLKLASKRKTAIVIVSIAFFLIVPVLVWALSDRLIFDVKGVRLDVLGKFLWIQANNPIAVFNSIAHAIFVKSSFGISLVCVALLGFLFEGRRNFLSEPLFIVGLSSFFCVWLVVGYTEYGLMWAAPGSDTGLSRWLLPSILLMTFGSVVNLGRRSNFP